jgi:preprotein translocase SecE subunit
MAPTLKDETVSEPRDDAPEEKDQQPREKAPQRQGGGQPPPARRDRQAGFFHIYKKGQGYWTRMGTVIGAGLIIALVINFLYTNMHVWVQPAFDHSAQFTTPAEKAAAVAHAAVVARNITLASCAGFLVGSALLVFWLMNKPTNADFLIATDSEMKKVNWTSRRELIGSTKVVIVFMFLIAGLLFLFDIDFGEMFYRIGVLKAPPLGEVSTLPVVLRWAIRGAWVAQLAVVIGVVVAAIRMKSERR